MERGAFAGCFRNWGVELGGLWAEDDDGVVCQEGCSW
jgi:hypothetical protein